MADLTSDAERNKHVMGSSLSQRVIERVAEAEGVDPIEIDPLYSVIDPDALDSLFRPQLKESAVPDSNAALRFEYHGYDVRVTATGRVTLTDHHN